VLHLEIGDLILMSGLLFVELLAVIVFELARELLTLPILYVDLAQIGLELLQQTIDRTRILLLNLLDLLLITLLHFEAFLLQLQVPIAFLLELLFKDALDLLHLLIVILLDFAHRLFVLLLLQDFLLLQVEVSLLQVANVLIFLAARGRFLVAIA